VFDARNFFIDKDLRAFYDNGMQNYFSRPLPHLMLLMMCIVCCTLCVSLAGMVLAALGIPHVRDSVYWLLTIQNIGMFLLPAYLAMRLVHRHALTRLGLRHLPKIVCVLCTVMLPLAIAPFVNLTAELNALLPLPDWAAELEKSAEQLTATLLATEDPQVFGLNLLCIALMPALVEEIFFRGFIQNTLHRLFGNPHWAIFVTAAVFSAFHMQFGSFLPRLALGIMLGYLFHWSKSLWLSIAAHFVNNAIAVCVYFYLTCNQLPITAVDAAMQGNTIITAAFTLTAALLLFCIYFEYHRDKAEI
jgi:membrane protease YdiL (CAAX protease family)